MSDGCKYTLALLAFFSALMAGFSASARTPDDAALIEGARQCTQHFARLERIHGIPSHLLAAISATESGRWNDRLGMVLPWPWTINAEGKGYYFTTRDEAVRKVKALQRQGMRSIDIGCMQVNLKHHPGAFANVEQAFDPRYNVAYAAQFLRGHYDELRNWNRAIAAYHSKTPKYGNKYLARVEKSWNAITGKVRIARAEAGERRPERTNLVRHRVISVRERGGSERREARDTSDLFKRLQRRSEASVRELSLADASSTDARGSESGSAGKPEGMMRIRDIDRLSGGFRGSAALKRRITVRDAGSGGRSAAATTIIRPGSVSHKPVLLAADNSAEQTAKPVRASDLFVTRHGSSAPSGGGAAKTEKANKPKFIFVQ